MCIICRINGISKYNNYVCFSCRKVWHTTNCPICKEKTHNMGSFFKAPKQNKVKEWKKIEKEYWKEKQHHELWNHIRGVHNLSSIRHCLTTSNSFKK